MSLCFLSHSSTKWIPYSWLGIKNIHYSACSGHLSSIKLKNFPHKFPQCLCSLATASSYCSHVRKAPLKKWCKQLWKNNANLFILVRRASYRQDITNISRHITNFCTIHCLHWTTHMHSTTMFSSKYLVNVLSSSFGSPKLKKSRDDWTTDNGNSAVK